MKHFFIAFLLPLLASIQFGEVSSNDGPYLFWNDELAQMLWIENGELHERQFDFSNQFVQTIRLKFSDLTYRIAKEKPISDPSEFQNVTKFFAIADIHGQFSIMIQLLRAHKIINSTNDWIFEDGHLVIIGDILDRGTQVTECLWLIHQLEWQAEEAGGKVHFLLGNHEIMIMQGDVRYVHDSYFDRTEKITGKAIRELFSIDTEFGRWLRSKNTVLKLNDFVFVHGGISPKIVEEKLTFNQINELIRSGIDIDAGKETNIVRASLLSNNGPLWYRGYWQSDKSYPQITERYLEEILSYFQAEKIIVGHTTVDSIATTFGGKVIGIDAGMKRGKNGEALFYENKILYRAFINGVKQKM
jgi:hypothetical protein